jgi:L-asparaginase
MALPRLLFLLTGGTLLMRSSAAPSGESSRRVGVDAGAAQRDLVAEVPALARLGTIESELLFNMDSADLGPEHWVILANAVHDAIARGRADGIVVVHGTDTMAYSASALGLMLGPLPCPVVFTGAQRPLASPRTDARQNLVDAALVATLAVAEVSIAFASRALRGVRATKQDSWALAAFDSPSCAPLVELGLDVEVGAHVRAAGALGPLDTRLERRVLAVRVFPGLDPALLTGAIRAGVRGLVLEAYGTGTMPHEQGSLIPCLEEARARGVPVVVVSQCHRGSVDLARYEGGAEAEAAGAISGGDLTVEAALAKTMIGLGRFGPGEDFVAFMKADVAGERRPG